ncbi:MAG: hypothetical protein ACPLRM_02300 [Anaerolineae bacterium]
MRVNSTGLGKTTLVVKLTGLTYEYVEGEGWVVRMGMESHEPVHWQMNARLQGPDLRDAVKMVLKLISNPIRLCRILALMFKGETQPVKGKAEPKLATHERR